MSAPIPEGWSPGKRDQESQYSKAYLALLGFLLCLSQDKSLAVLQY